MCATCGCSAGDLGSDHAHVHGAEGGHGAGHGPSHRHEHPHEHPHADGHLHDRGPVGAQSPGRTIELAERVMARNDSFAAANRRCFAERGILALNLLSSPGSGKTTLLVETIGRLQGGRPVFVIEGDQQTSLDAERIRGAGAPAHQLTTGRGCHLDAHGVAHALLALEPSPGSLLFIENVGNLVCPAGFDLGEAHKVVVLSVTEGEDKPLKYPDAFAAADLVLLNKIDLLPHLRFDVDQCVANARRVHPGIVVLPVSATTGEGLPAWLGWLAERGR